VFCLRNNIDGVGDASSLWLEREPTIDEIKLALDTKVRELLPNHPEEIVFCGFGEPMIRADVVVSISEYIKEMYSSLYGRPAPLVRLNTNGLAFLMHPGFDVRRLSCVDVVSISLNADDAKEFQRVARPRYGEAAFGSMLDFAKEARGYTSVVFSVVEGTLSPERQGNCQVLADSLGVPLRIRPME